MLKLIRSSISNKLMLVVVASSFMALLVYGISMLLYDARTYHDAVVKDVTTLANIIADVSTPALEFNDPDTARDHLELLRTRPIILQAALFTGEGQRFAEYARDVEAQQKWPATPQLSGFEILGGNRIEVWRPVAVDGRPLGNVYILARYELAARLRDYALILACVMAASLGSAAFVAAWLRGAVTKPIFAVTHIARQVMQRRDFSLRAEKSSEDEIGVLVDAFNDMLGEVGQRAAALEASNRSLEHEMAERQAAEDALRLADRRKDEFLATLAHELRNPLAPLVNGVRIMRLPGTGPEQLETVQTVMERQLKQMVRLVDDLLDVSRITTGKLTIAKTQVDVQAVMRDAVDSSGPLIVSYGHKLTVDYPEQPVFVDGDPVRLAQVFSNLLNNAAKYTEQGGSIMFGAQLQGDAVVISVADTGIGIAPDMLSDIFGMFTQVDRSLERAQAGLGVGLALSRHLVELHGGSLDVSSAGRGLGSTFSVRLHTVAAQCTEPEELVPSSSPHRRRILLVDDNVDYVSTMATLLDMLGHEVRTAHEGAEALRIAGDFTPDFIFMDIGMPGLNGYQVAQYLRQLPSIANCVIVAVTGWGQESDRQLSRAAGFDHHLVKPVELSQILTIIDALPPLAVNG